jgi:alkylation response protein AidB-like acyl-CoA dehydrogenase
LELNADMDFDLSNEQRLLAQTARACLQRACPLPRVRELATTPTACDDALWSALVEQGWTGMTLPERVGGLGLDFVGLCVVAEEMGRACLPGPFFSTFWSACLLERVGDPSQRAPLLARIAAGDAKATVAWLEPHADWDPNSIEMAAERKGDCVRLTGRKRFVTDALAADLILVVVRLDEGWAVAPLPRDSAGVFVHPTPAMDETRKLADVGFLDAVLPASSLLAAPDSAELDRANDFAAAFLCAELVGVMQWMLDASVEYAKARRQFDRPIGAFQAVQHQCADMLLYTESARSAAYYAAWALAADDPSALSAAAVAKSYCSEAGRRVGNHACQIHGGVGFTWEHDLHLYYKRAKLAEALLGDPTFHRRRLAQAILDPSPAA